MTIKASYDFVYCEKRIIAGLIVYEDGEIECSVYFNFTPGDKGIAPSLSHPGEPPTPPEIEITEITIFGHDPKRIGDKYYSGERRPVPAGNIIYDPISKWLMEDRFDEMCDAAEGYRTDADYLRDRSLES